jgi:hypothetical protein
MRSLTRTPVRHDVLSRREALRRIGAVTLGLAATACTPVTIIRSLYPDARSLDEHTIARTLAAFVGAVLPDADDPGKVARLFLDPSLRFAPYRAMLAADLRRRASEQGGAGFERLDLETRTAIVERVIVEDGIAGRLYAGGIFLAQVVFYGGLWHERGACPCIGYEGAYAFAGIEATTYPQPERFLPLAITTDGNPN